MLVSRRSSQFTIKLIIVANMDFAYLGEDDLSILWLIRKILLRNRLDFLDILIGPKLVYRILMYIKELFCCTILSVWVHSFTCMKITVLYKP